MYGTKLKSIWIIKPENLLFHSFNGLIDQIDQSNIIFKTLMYDPNGLEIGL